MQTYRIAVTEILDASPEQVYSVFADYRVSHPAVLPKQFLGLNVEQGGYGEGTIFNTKVKSMGVTQSYRMRVTEPVPGSLLMETDINTGQVTTFAVSPVEGGRKASVTITTDFPTSGGLSGALSRAIISPVVNRLYREELRLVEAYIRRKVTQPMPAR